MLVEPLEVYHAWEQLKRADRDPGVGGKLCENQQDRKVALRGEDFGANFFIQIRMISQSHTCNRFAFFDKEDGNPIAPKWMGEST